MYILNDYGNDSGNDEFEKYIVFNNFMSFI